MLELYHHGTSVCAAKVRTVCAEKGLEWSGHYIDILKGEQFAPAYVALNPKAVVPTLVHDGAVIRESTVICEYLDEAFPEIPLRPADALGRAAMRVWTKAVDEGLHPACAVLTFTLSHRHGILKLAPDKLADFFAKTPDPVRRERKRQWVEKGVDAPDVAAAIRLYDNTLGQMEAALADGPWLLGERFSLADVALTPYVNRLHMLGLAELWQGVRPALAGWFERIRARPSFQPALYQYIPPEMVDEMKANGSECWPRLKEMLAA